MDFDTVIKKRKSTRSFKSKKPRWDHILEAIEAALLAPSEGTVSTHHLKFVLVEDPNRISKLTKLSDQSWIAQSQFLIVVVSNDIHLENLYGERGRIYSRQQAGAAIENLLLKLTDMGIDSCWVGEYKDERVRQLLKIPSHFQIEAIIPIGFGSPEKKVPHKKKKKLETHIFWENWFTTRRGLKEPFADSYK
jgi:nitroreductase